MVPHFLQGANEGLREAPRLRDPAIVMAHAGQVRQRVHKYSVNRFVPVWVKLVKAAVVSSVTVTIWPNAFVSLLRHLPTHSRT